MQRIWGNDLGSLTENRTLSERLLLELLLQHLLEGSSILLEALDTFGQLNKGKR